MAADTTNQRSTPDTDQTPDSPTPDNTEAGNDFRPARNELELTGREAEPPPEEEEGEEGPKYYVDSKRNAILARAREAKKATATEFSGSQHDKTVLYGAGNDADQVSQAEKDAFGRQPEQPPAQQPPQQEQQPPQQRQMNYVDPELLKQQVTVIVDGQPQVITFEDALRSFQINTAATARLQEANRLLAAAKDTVRGEANQPPPPEGERDDSGFTRPPAGPDFLTAAMEKMQFGTPDEGAAAFRSAVQQLMQSHAPQADPSETVMVRLEDRKAMDEIRRYAEANPDVADPVMQQIIGPISSRLMAEDLMQHIPFEELRVRVRNFDDLKNLHVRARAANAEGIHSAAQILAEAHQRAKDWRSGREPRQGYVPPQPGQDTRSQRKEALTTQPAMRRQAPTLPNQQQRSQEQSRSDAVMKMRAARGQAV